MSDKQTLAVLTRAKALLSDPTKWTVEAFARDHNGEKISPYSNRACQFCAIGAIRHEERQEGQLSGAESLLRSVAHHFNGSIVYNVNDKQGYDAVMALYDRAIHRAQQRI
jgi:hypothetical protein